MIGQEGGSSPCPGGSLSLPSSDADTSAFKTSRVDCLPLVCTCLQDKLRTPPPSGVHLPSDTSRTLPPSGVHTCSQLWRRDTKPLTFSAGTRRSSNTRSSTPKGERAYRAPAGCACQMVHPAFCALGSCGDPRRDGKWHEQHWAVPGYAVLCKCQRGLFA